MLKSNYYTPPTQIDEVVFEKLIPSDHYLHQVDAIIDFECVRNLVQDCYSAHMGRGAEDPVRLMKLCFLQHHYRLSDREVIAQVQVNVAYRWFLNLSLESVLPVPSLLSQFRTRLGVDRHQALFDEIVGQAREKGLVKDRLRLKDATHIIANIAIPSAIALIAQCRDLLLKCTKPYAKDKVIEETIHAEQIRVATSDLKDEDRLLQRVVHLRSIVLWADLLQQHLGSSMANDLSRQRFDQALATAHKALHDHTHPKGKDRLISGLDPDARTSFHQGYFDGYLLDVSLDADSEVITALNILPGNGNEAQDAVTLLKQEETTFENDVAQLSMDAKGFDGKVLDELGDPEGLAVEVFVPPREWAAKSYEGFALQDFSFDEAQAILTCPAGQTTTTHYQNPQETSQRYEFKRSQCASCPLLTQCMPKLPQKKGRSVTINDYQDAYDQAIERANTPQYAQVKKQHPRIERKLSDMINTHQARTTRYRTKARVKIHYLLVGMVTNIRRIVKLVTKPKATTVSVCLT